MAKKNDVGTLQQRYQNLREELCQVGLLVQGTITPRTIEREDAQRPGQRKKLGPYYQWTRKQRGKTVTVNLARGQVKAYAAAIRNHRRLDKILGQMREISLKILELTTEGVTKRPRRT